MPAIITHDTFGRDAYLRHRMHIGVTHDEVEAFLLGNQGPDPFFYSVADVRLRSVHHLGSLMHSEKPTELLCALWEIANAQLDGKANRATSADKSNRATSADKSNRATSADKGKRATLADKGNRESSADSSIAKAYVLGFLGHYALDSTMHPLVYAYEYALCDAGEEGLSRKDGREVHAVIESEFDEMVLFTKRGETVFSFDPSRQILRGSTHMLSVVSHLCATAVKATYDRTIPLDAFARSVRCFRATQRLFHSKKGTKRAIISRIEECVRPYSFYRAMSHRALPLTQSAFDNHEHGEWQNPFTGDISTEGFWDLYAKAQEYYDMLVDAVCNSASSYEAVFSLTGNKNFSGEAVGETVGEAVGETVCEAVG